MGAELGLIACSMKVKQAFGNVSPEKSEPGDERHRHCSCLGWSNLEGADWWQR